MRIVQALEFLALPEHMVFAMYAAGQLGPLCIKGPTMPGEGMYLYRQIQPTLDGPVRMNPLKKLLSHPPLENEVALEFSAASLEEQVMPRQCFAVWDKSDVTRLIEALLPCAEMEVPDHPVQTLSPLATYPGVIVAAEGRTVQVDGVGPMCLDLNALTQLYQVMREKERLDGHLEDRYKPFGQVELTHAVSNFRLRDSTLVCDVELHDTPKARRVLESGGIDFYPQYGLMCGDLLLTALWIKEPQPPVESATLLPFPQPVS